MYCELLYPAVFNSLSGALLKKKSQSIEKPIEIVNLIYSKSLGV